MNFAELISRYLMYSHAEVIRPRSDAYDRFRDTVFRTRAVSRRIVYWQTGRELYVHGSQECELFDGRLVKVVGGRYCDIPVMELPNWVSQTICQLAMSQSVRPEPQRGLMLVCDGIPFLGAY